MSAWWSHLRGRPFYWVLDGANPAASLLMLQEVVERPGNAPGLKEARLALREWQPVRRLIASLDEGWGDTAAALLFPRYRTPLWRLRLLAELGVPGDEEAVAVATDRLLDAAMDEAHVVNLNAIVLSIPLTFGYSDDQRVKQRLDRLVGEVNAGSWPSAPSVRADWLAQAVATLGLALRAGLVNPFVCERAATALIALDPLELDQRWSQPGFPIFDQPDLLFAVRHLLQSGARDERIRPWVEAIEAWQENEGGWRAKRSLQQETDVLLEDERGPSRWLTAQGLYVLRAYYGEQAS